MFAKILLFIKSMSLAAKIMSVAAFVVIVGSTTTAIVVVNISRSNDQAPAQQDSVAQNDQPTETGEQPKEEEKPEGDSENPQENEQNNDQTPTQEPTTDPVQPTPVPEPEKTCSDLQNCDYNLNDRYVAGSSTIDFYSLPEGVRHACEQDGNGNYYFDILPVAVTKTFYEIGLFDGTTAINPVAGTKSISQQAYEYGLENNLANANYCGVGGTVREATWQDMVNGGRALDEAKCAQWGLSCGRW